MEKVEENNPPSGVHLFQYGDCFNSNARHHFNGHTANGKKQKNYQAPFKKRICILPTKHLWKTKRGTFQLTHRTFIKENKSNI